MRVAAIAGPGYSPKILRHFKTARNIDWTDGVPATSEGTDAVLLFGGDGTIHRHLRQLVDLHLPVLIVPTGSGNDFARSFGIRSINDALRAWREFCAAKNNIRTVDLGVIRPLGTLQESEQQHFRYFCTIAGIGLSSGVSRRANAWPRWLRGSVGYALSLIPALGRYTQPQVKISSNENGRLNSGCDHLSASKFKPMMLAAFANTATFGGGMKIAPRAMPDDGLLDICIIASIDRFKLACLFPTVYFGRHIEVKEVDYFQAARASVETEHPLDVYADGEFVCRTPVEIGIREKSLQAITPPAT